MFLSDTDESNNPNNSHHLSSYVGSKFTDESDDEDYRIPGTEGELAEVDDDEEDNGEDDGEVIPTVIHTSTQVRPRHN